MGNYHQSEFARRFLSNLRRVRIEKDYTQEYMAESIAPKHATTYSKIERGVVRLELEDAIKICDYLGMTIHEMLDYGEPSRSNDLAEPKAPYGKQELNIVHLSLAIDGRVRTLNRNIETLKKVHDALSTLDDQI